MSQFSDVYALSEEAHPVARTILHELDSFAVILGPNLQPVYANPTARGSSPISGTQLTDPRFLSRASRALETGKPRTYLPGSKDEAPLRIHLIPIKGSHLVVLVDDLGEEQRVNAMRRDFIANVSHELKTPISAITLLAEAVLEGADDAEIVRQFSTQLLEQARRLGSLTRDVIQLSEAQSALRPGDRQRVDLRELVSAELEAHRTYAEAKDVQLVLHLPGNEERAALALGNPAGLSSALGNLLSNAIRYSPAGEEVTVALTFELDTLLVSVTDRGDGIPLEYQHRIFERFYRVDKSRSREGGGTGLGLSIAHHIMRGHGGAIDLWSRPGEGAQFTLTIPLLQDEKEQDVSEYFAG